MQTIRLLCRCCTREYFIPDAETLRECPACGTLNARPQAQGAFHDVLLRATQQRSACDFANAERSYQYVLNDHPDEYEALWGAALCRYGVEYVEDPRTRRLMPTCHFTRLRPLQEDPDFLRACELAPEEIRAQYQQDAAYIDAIQIGVRSASSRCEPFDVFLCYKATVPGSGESTPDLARVRDLYYKLTQMGLRVFFAHETLQQAAGANYEARIYHALHTARVMLVICSDGSWLNTSWVRSEWSRFLERADNDPQLTLVPLLYDGMQPSRLPQAFTLRSLQGLRMGELDALDNLRAILGEQIPTQASAPVQQPAHQELSTETLAQRTERALADSRWDTARTYASELLRRQPGSAQAHLNMMLAEMQLHTAAELATCGKPFADNPAWQQALDFADDELHAELSAIAQQANQAAQARFESRRKRVRKSLIITAICALPLTIVFWFLAIIVHAITDYAWMILSVLSIIALVFGLISRRLRFTDFLTFSIVPGILQCVIPDNFGAVFIAMLVCPFLTFLLVYLKERRATT